MKHTKRTVNRPIFESLQATKPQTRQQRITASLRKFTKLGGKILKGICLYLGFMMLISIISTGVFLAKFSPQQSSALPDIPEKMVVTLKLEGKLIESDSEAISISPFEPIPPTLRQITTALHNASQDPRVKALSVELTDTPFEASLPQIQEIRTAIKAFKATGKKTYIYALNYGVAAGMGEIYLASAFDRRFVPRLGTLSMTGLRLEMPFFRKALDKIGVQPNFIQRKAYKTAYESATHDAMTPANRKAMTAIVRSIKTQLSNDISADLGKTPEAFERLVDLGLFTAKEAKEKGLVTDLAFRDDFIETIHKDILPDADKDTPLFGCLCLYSKGTLHKQAQAKTDKQKKVALIHVSGAIMTSSESGFDGIADAQKISQAIKDAARYDNIEAILIRINSPGGSPVASDQILQAIHKAKAKGKKVIVSMGELAASGGYWVASGADYIVASPSTLTGSIGVVGGKVATEKLWEKLGVNWDSSIAWGQNSGMWSLQKPFSKTEKARIDLMLDDVYDSFIDRVSKGRNLTPKQTEKIAQGRVWIGAHAKEKGLVDELGGLNTALDYTAKQIGLKSRDDIHLVELPRPLTPLELLMEILEEQGALFDLLKMQIQVFKAISTTLGISQNALPQAALMQSSPALIYAPQRL